MLSNPKKILDKENLLIVGSAFFLFVVCTFSTILIFYNTNTQKPSISISKDTFINKISEIKERAPRVFIVQSGSMEPAIKTGGIVFSMPQDKYSQGDVITFEQNGRLITHRAVFKRHDESGEYYMTAGDANQDFDNWSIRDEQIVGKVKLHIPYVGYLANQAKTPQGFILLVVVPATIVVYEEMKLIFKELLRLIKRFAGYSSIKAASKNTAIASSTPKTSGNETFFNNKSLSKKDLQNADYYWLKKAMAVLPVTGAFLAFTALSASFFFDTELSPDNLFSASETYTQPNPPQPQPEITKLDINEVYYDVGHRTNGGNSEDDPENEWIEIYNPNNFDVPFKNWEICDNNRCVTINPNVSVPALGFALVSRDASTWSFWTIPDNVEKINALGGTPLELANSGDIVVLKNPEGVEVDRMSYGNNIDGFVSGCMNQCPSSDEGNSLERQPTGIDTNSAIDFVERNPPTPGS